MTFLYRLFEDGGGWTAECETVEASGNGASADEAVTGLESVLRSRFAHVDGMAPPDAPQPSVKLVRITEPSSVPIETETETTNEGE